ncbi:MAG: ornithine cyclodeaminase, partial [Clostridiaceae bacterium]|nr:ornithine cyclodeaminase [Clostridiaceae bacterium]
VILPSKMSIKPAKDIFYNVMPSLLPKYNVGGLKLVTRYPARVPTLDSQIMLFDYSTGSFNALLDGNFITTMRTGAVAAHTIKMFAKENFNKIGIIGLGNQARATLKVLLALYPNYKLTLKLLKYKNQHIDFEEYVKNLTNPKSIVFEFCDSYEDTVIGSDVIISSVTYFEDDICSDECFDEGCLVVPIHTRGFTNCDLFFDKIYADDTDHVKGFKYFSRFKKFAEVSNVINGGAEGRKNNTERIMVYNIGLSIHDIFFAQRIFELSLLKGLGKKIGKEIDMNNLRDKFWI